jgi:hypothetical protein
MPLKAELIGGLKTGKQLTPDVPEHGEEQCRGADGATMMALARLFERAQDACKRAMFSGAEGQDSGGRSVRKTRENARTAVGNLVPAAGAA